MFNLAKMMALILHKEIERKINKLRNMRFGFMHANKTTTKKQFEKKPYAGSVTVVINYYSLS